jgi:hypothetical protein
MLHNDVIQGLTLEGVPHSVIEELLAAALIARSAESKKYGFRVINTNAGMPAEYRIERI